MSDKELEEYINKIKPNFDSHLEKGTIEMSNEYYNLLEEKMVRLINKNQKLKKKYENAVADYETTMSELQELKKQLEKKYSKIGTLTNEVLYEENTKLINQQKEFIEYLENEIKERNIQIAGYHPTTQLLIEQIIETEKMVLSKYKEIIGDDK